MLLWTCFVTNINSSCCPPVTVEKNELKRPVLRVSGKIRKEWGKMNPKWERISLLWHQNLIWCYELAGILDFVEIRLHSWQCKWVMFESAGLEWARLRELWKLDMSGPHYMILSLCALYNTYTCGGWYRYVLNVSARGVESEMYEKICMYVKRNVEGGVLPRDFPRECPITGVTGNWWVRG